MGTRVKVSKQGNVIEVTELTGCNRSCHAVKLDKGHWMDPETGEVHEYQSHGTKRTDNLQELRQSFAKMRAIINANCQDPSKLRWVVLTYRENMQDLERLYTDFKAFMKRFRRRYGPCEYIAIPEPQGRGAWHMHLILIFEGRAPFIPNDGADDSMEAIWGHGYTKTKSLKDVDNVGAYLSAYLGDIEAGEGEDCDVVKVAKDGSTKRIVKGGRLHLYPAGMNVYRCSRGVKKPEEYWVETPEQTLEVQRYDEELSCYVRSYTAKLDNGIEIGITKRYYNLRRPKRAKRE